jgi:hypothetical protein
MTGHDSKRPLISVDLAQSARLAKIFEGWPEGQLEASLQRYEKFLHLAGMYPEERLVPTVDIDMLWHLHMLHPKAYAEDCQRMFGRILDHDGDVGTDAEAVAGHRRLLSTTEQLWRKAYGEEFADHGRSLVGRVQYCGGGQCSRTVQPRPSVDHG